MKLVSVVIPVFNTGEPLRDCLESVLSQTHTNLEVLVVDDHSTDIQTLEILYYFVKNDHRVKLTLNPENHGVAFCRNLGVSLATGDYFAFLDSKDCLEPDFVERLSKAISADQTDFAVCKVKNIAVDKDVDQEPDLGFAMLGDHVIKVEDFVHSDHFGDLPVSAVGKFFKTRSYVKANLSFREDMRFAEDQDWSYRVFCQLNSFSVLDFVGISHLIKSTARKLVISEDNLIDEVHALEYKHEVLKQHNLFDQHNAILFQQCCLVAGNIGQQADGEVKKRIFDELAQVIEHLGFDIKLSPSNSDLFKASLAYKATKVLQMKNQRVMAKARYKLYMKLLKNK